MTRSKEDELMVHRNSEVSKLPVYTVYFQAFLDVLGETALEPEDGRKSGFVTIFLYTPNDTLRVAIYRHVASYTDGNKGIQDEIQLGGHNQRVQLNFELNPSGALVQFPNADVPSAYMSEVIDSFKTFSTEKGASLWCGGKKRYESNGEAWVPYVEPQRNQLGFDQPKLGQSDSDPDVGLTL